MKEHLYVKKSIPEEYANRGNIEYLECNNCKLCLLIRRTNYEKIFSMCHIFNNQVINRTYCLDNISLGSFEYSSCEEFIIRNIIE